jgi:outer membrane immunogenic protein
VPTSTGITGGGRGFLGRFGGGCDYQFQMGSLGSWVIGAFGDYDLMSIKGTNTLQNVAGGAFGAPPAGTETETGAWYAGIRLGYLVTPKFLAFISGGWSGTRFGQVNFVNTNTGTSNGAFLPAQTYNGWFLGFGTENALDMSFIPIKGLFWRNEYRYASYGGQDLPLLGPGAGAGFGEHSTKYTQTITSSLVWRFY